MQQQPINYKVFILPLIVMFALMMSSSVWAKANLSKIRIGQSPEKTRVVFEIKKNDGFKIFHLSHPARIVVDFKKAQTQIDFKRLKLLDERVKRLRVSHNNQRTRVILDLRKGFDYHYFILAKNKQGAERVVVDVLPSLAVVKKPKVKSKPKVIKVKPIKAKPKKQVAHLTKKVNKAKKSKSTKQVATKAPAKRRTVVAKKSVSHQAPSKLVKRPVKMAKVTQTPLVNIPQNAPKPLLHNDLIVAIDAGHGGKDTGAIGYHHTYEKTVTLKLAKKLKRMIDKQPGMHAVLTRKKDVFIPLHKRVQLAHQMDADIFISLHADAFDAKNVRGGSVYILSTNGASSMVAKLLAKSENASLQSFKQNTSNSDVAFVLSDLSREANIRASHKLANSVLREMKRHVRLHKKTVQSANFAVLKSIDMPSLLIETAYISNPGDEKKLKSSHFQSKMARSIVAGLKHFAKQNARQPRWGETLYVHYRVKSGDTLSEIASNYEVSTRRLKQLNRIHNADELYIGKKLKIPLSEKLVAGL